MLKNIELLKTLKFEFQKRGYTVEVEDTRPKCKHCQMPFEPTRKTHKFCSTSCRVLWHREKNG